MRNERNNIIIELLNNDAKNYVLNNNSSLAQNGIKLSAKDSIRVRKINEI